MNNRIDKERIHLMSPCATVCAAAEIAPVVEESVLRAAIEKVLRTHAILCCRVILDADGEARFAPNGAPVVSLAPFGGDARALIAAQQNRPFAIQRGELARFFFHSEDGRTRLVCAVHHVTCDGGSLVRLLRALLLALDGETVPAQPVHLLSPDDLPAHPDLNPLLRLKMKRTNRRWQKTAARSQRTISPRCSARTPRRIRCACGFERFRRTRFRRWNVWRTRTISR